MFKLINNGLEIKSRQFHSFVQKPQMRNVYVDDVRYQLSMPFLLFVKRIDCDTIYTFAFKHFMVKDNEIKYNNDNPPHKLPLPNIDTDGYTCLGVNGEFNLYQLLQIFYQANFRTKEIAPYYPKELENYQPIHNIKFQQSNNLLFFNNKIDLEYATKCLMEFSIQRNSLIYPDLIINDHKFEIFEIIEQLC